MATPSMPIIQVHPWATANSLSFYWSPPTSQGDGPVTNYSILCSAINYNRLVNSSTFGVTVSSLTNQIEYTFQISALNFYGYGPYASFNPVQPGIPSVSTICTGASVDANIVDVTWSYILNPRECVARYFIVSAVPSTPSLSTTRYVAYPNQRSYQVPNLQADTYTFLVQAVNDANWSNPSTSQPVIING